MDRYSAEFVTFDGAQVQVLIEHPRPANRSPDLLVPCRPVGLTLGFNSKNQARRAKRLGRVVTAFDVIGHPHPQTCVPVHALREYLQGVSPLTLDTKAERARLAKWTDELADALASAVREGRTTTRRTFDSIGRPVEISRRAHHGGILDNDDMLEAFLATEPPPIVRPVQPRPEIVPPKVVDDLLLDLALALKPTVTNKMADLAATNAELIVENLRLREQLAAVRQALGA